MKKLFVYLIFIATIFSACSNSHKIEVGQSMSDINNKYTAYVTINNLSVYKIGNNYLITIDDGDIIQKLVEFSSNRKCNRIQGFNLLKNDNIDQLLNVNFKELTKKIGQPHLDIGSGFYIPAYITEDANLILFELENGTVIEIVKKDLLTNRIVNRISE